MFSDWPTIPQLYVCGEFVGGSDIMIEMYQSGELGEMIEKVCFYIFVCLCVMLVMFIATRCSNNASMMLLLYMFKAKADMI